MIPTTFYNDNIFERVTEWFQENNLDHAVIGFSGGIDSAVTAALCHRAGIDVTLVRVSIDDQTFSSDISVGRFMDLYPGMKSRKFFPSMDNGLSNAGKEAALPILRNSYFYGVAAELWSEGKRACVVGTTNFDEAAFLGFWGKASDAAQDFYPISHLHKSQVIKLAIDLGVPESIINAVPSGDLQFSGDLNDLKMIGATYPQIEAIAKDAPYWSKTALKATILSVDNPTLLCNNILKNSFKYEKPFPGSHLSGSLEIFRNYQYPIILNTVKELTIK